MAPTTFTFRTATAADVPHIEACVQQAYQHYIERIGAPPGPMLDDYAAVVRDHQVFVAESADGEFAGLLVLIPQEGTMLLDNVAVHPDFQGMGLGKRLMQKAEKETMVQGFDSIILYTHELMVENRAIYKKARYAETHRVFEKGLNRVYMRKKLTQ
ncbi:MAG: GNAT family N-acetyltransferase [Chloroflexota bacterium]